MPDLDTPPDIMQDSPPVPKQRGMLKRTEDAIKLVVEKGVDPEMALRIVHRRNDISRTSVHNLNKRVERWSIERPGAQKIAHNALVKFAAGKDVNGIVPKAVDVRACAERIIDQVAPVIRRSESVNVNVEVCPVDLDRYR